jgi:chlorite dismutase
VQAVALEVDPAWRRLPPDVRRRSVGSFLEACGPAAGAGGSEAVITLLYTSVGLEPRRDLLLWSLGPTVEALEERAGRALGAGLGRWARVRTSLLGHLGQSPYVRRPAAPTLFAGPRARYLLVYPFSKSAGWYRLAHETRQAIMREHIRVGRRYPQVRQLLAGSFGMDEQDYLVAYETDDLGAFSDLVLELRSTEGRRATVLDAPLLVGVRRTPEEMGRLLGA